jgi:flagellar biosynthetic protein FlhB
MADDKTEKPTPKRLKEARKKGQVSKSTDLTQAALFLTAGAILYLSGPKLMAQLKVFMIDSFSPRMLRGDLDSQTMVNRLGDAFVKLLVFSAPLLMGLVIAAIAVNFAQIRGLIFSAEAMTLKFEKLNPVVGFQNLFLKSKTYTELIKNLLKFTIVSWLSYLTLHGQLRDLILVSRVGITQVAMLAPQLLFSILFKVGSVFVIFGTADFALQHHFFMKGLMMSKEEIKREYKEQEGDPEVKGHRRSLHMALLRENAMKKVPKAQVVVVNPTHLAVALQYHEEYMNTPRVIAKGEMNLAKKIVEIARRHDVPVMQNIALAHSLYTLELEEDIPEELYETIAEILNLASRLANGKQN